MNKITLALAGNPNVGKSVFFNQLTGGSQHVGNWPGKTVERAEGNLIFLNKSIKVIDLPGTNSLSALSQEEKISREFILSKKSDVILNVADASSLEKNLYLTLQLLEMETNIVLALNMVDVAKEKGIKIDSEALSKELGIPVVPTIAIHSKGIEKSMLAVVNKLGKEKKQKNKVIKYSPKIESSIERIISKIKDEKYPKRWIAIKLLENDKEAKQMFKSNKHLLSLAKKEKETLEKLFGQEISILFSSERYRVISSILSKSQKITEKGISIHEKLDNILMHNIFGYIFLLLALITLFYSIFLFGNFLSELLDSILTSIFSSIQIQDPLILFFWSSIIEGLIAGITVAIPYLLPFYILLAILEDSGYLPRMAFLMDGIMHRIGLHGKAFIPLVLGYGCTVPACVGCRIMESEKQHFLTALLVTLIPCAARSIVIFGLVAAFVGIEWAIALYLFNLIVVFLLGLIASRVIPGDTPALIMDMPTYKIPDFKSTVTRAWFRIRNFVYTAFPIIILVTFLIKGIEFFGLLEPLSTALSPITVDLLGLPAIIGITLIVGILRKELIIILLAALLGTTDFGSVLTPVQLIVYAVVSIFYIPCAATIATLYKEFGFKKALGITVFDIIFAIILAAIVRFALISSGVFVS